MENGNWATESSANGLSADARREERFPVAIPARLRSGLAMAIDSASGAGGAIASIIVTDISHQGLAAVADQSLVAGTRIIIEMPFVGPREAEIRWISGNRAGCHFVEPLSENELHASLRDNAMMAEYFPGLFNGFANGRWGAS